MNIRTSADSPPDGGKDPADFTLDKIGINKLNDNVLMKNPRMIIFSSHDCLFPTRDPNARCRRITDLATVRPGKIPDCPPRWRP